MSVNVKIKQLGRRGNVDVWSVDGFLVRRHLDIDFTNFGQHYRFPFIPENEVWIDHEATPGEANYYTTHLMVERRLMKSGVPLNQALAVANALERKERLRSGELPVGLPLSRDALEAIHVRQLATLPKGIAVWLIDGRKVRMIDPNFAEGGHDYVYKYVPPNEIWIDDDLRPKEMGFILAHEWFERVHMMKGKRYEEAHRMASAFEEELRNNPGVLSLLPDIIAAEEEKK